MPLGDRIKWILQSKTFWVNALAFVVWAIDMWQPLVPLEWKPVVAGVLALVNIWLRSITDQAVTIAPQ